MPSRPTSVPRSPATDRAAGLTVDPHDDEGPDDATAFVRALTRPTPTPFVPEVVLHIADEPYGPWEAVERRGGTPGAPPPFWAFCWPGGAALARYLLDQPTLVAGRRVADLGCGSGLVGLAALQAGAAHVLAVDLDVYALAATRLNATANGVPAGVLDVVRGDVLALAAGRPACADLLDRLLVADVVLAGDLFFERELAAGTLALLRRAAAAGCTVLAGDPGRTHLPRDAFAEVTAYDVPVSRSLEDAPVRRTRVLRLA